MKLSSRAFAQAAISLVGAPFRLRGRDPQTGLDCIGLVATSLELCGRPVPSLPDYQLRNTDIAALLALLPGAGFVPTRGAEAGGDLLLAAPSAAQHHLAIASGRASFIHAHAGLGRVVETPAPLPWPVIGRWRLA